MVPEQRTCKIPYTVCKMVPEERCEVVKCRRCHYVTEERCCKVPYTVCRLVTHECVRHVPCTTCTLEPYCVTYKVCRCVPVCVPVCEPVCEPACPPPCPAGPCSAQPHLHHWLARTAHRGEDAATAPCCDK
jgi:hypothetical protein